MLLDYHTLLMAVGFSAVCLSFVLLATWMTTRTDSFLLTCAVGFSLVVVHAFTYAAYALWPLPVLMAVSFGFLLLALGVLYGAARQFRTGRSSWARVLRVATPALAVLWTPMLFGYTGIGTIAFNIAAATLLTFIAREYWRARPEAPFAIAVLCGLYLFVATTFMLCAVLLLLDARLVLDGAPANWAEDLNVIAGITGLPGIGAMTLALNQSRAAQVHKRDAMTDPLTGLFNRRALFDMVGAMSMGREIAVIVFDIDRFKTINDARGHATGDRVLVHFARALRQHLGKGQLAARLGGEEFALVLSDTGPETALAHAEAVRASFAQATLAAKDPACTASAGIAFGGSAREDFEAALNLADQMLYAAKRGGRDRVAVAGSRMAEDALRPRSSSHP